MIFLQGQLHRSVEFVGFGFPIMGFRALRVGNLPGVGMALIKGLLMDEL
jgi:hypothetical protein